MSKAKRKRLPKLCGGDTELSNGILGSNRYSSTGHEAARLLLGQINGAPHMQSRYKGPYDDYGAVWNWSDQGWRYGYSSPGAADLGRKYLPTGGCVYIDHGHLELCTPEVRSAYDFVAWQHAMFRMAERARRAAEAQLPPGQKLLVLANNSDGQGNSYGGHVNVLLTRQAWENLFRYKLHHLLYLASYQISSLVCTGQGKVGAENGAPSVRFQISQRADFFHSLVGSQTMHDRPLVNSRDEGLCGSIPNMARLHCIFYDTNLCQVATLLKVGGLQMVTAMIEAGRINPNLLLDHPLQAVGQYSHDPGLRTRARMASGSHLTAVELQLLFLEEARKFASTGGFDRIVPQATDILSLWEDSLLKLRARDFEALSTRLDWVLKYQLLERTLGQHPDLTWESPQLKHLDHVYSSLNQAEGLYWAYERCGGVETVVSDAQIEHSIHEPPEDTRAWTRGMLLQRAHPSAIDWIDWDQVRFCLRKPTEPWTAYRTLQLANPLAWTKAKTHHLFTTVGDFDTLIGLLEERQRQPAAPVQNGRAPNGHREHAAAYALVPLTTMPARHIHEQQQGDHHEIS
jgi:proteasome accessory factor A